MARRSGLASGAYVQAQRARNDWRLKKKNTPKEKPVKTEEEFASDWKEVAEVSLKEEKQAMQSENAKIKSVLL